MANRNYRNYSKPEVENSEIEKPMVNDTETEDVEVVETAITKTPEPTMVEGTVKDCYRLNVREEPSLKAGIKREIPVDTKLQVDVLGSTKTWFEVRLDDGTYGFVMADYVDCDLPSNIG